MRLVVELGVLEDVEAVLDSVQRHLVEKDAAVLEEGASDGKRPVQGREGEVLVQEN